MRVIGNSYRPLDIQLADIPVSPFTNTYSLEFDGVDDVLSLGENSTVGTGGVNTLSFWVKGNAQSTGGYTNYLFSAYGGYNWWSAFLGNGTNLYWRNINGVAYNLAPNLFDGNWHNVVVIRNPSDLVNGSLRIYVDNGTPLDRTLDYRYGVAGLYNGALGTIGNNNTASSGFNGNIEEVAVWNSEITPSDVASIYNNGAPTDLSLLSTPPSNWYRNGDNGAYKSPQWLIPNNENKDKVSNYSTQFDGVDDVLAIQPTLSIDATNGLTLSFWVNLNVSAAWDYVFSSGTLGVDSSLNLRWNAGGGLTSFVSGSSQATGISTGYGTWRHIVMTVNYSNGDVKFYMDGVISATVLSFGSSYSNVNLAAIGAYNSAGVQPTNGKLNNVSIFRSVFDQTDITSLYNGGTPTDLTSLSPHLWLKMGDNATFTGGVWTVPDEVGTNDGTSANMTIEDRIGEAPNSTNNALSLNMDKVDRTTDVPT